MICKYCGHVMGQKILNGQTLDICAACGGIWIDREELGALLKPAGESISEKRLNELKKDLEWSSGYDGAPERMCPKCGGKMPRHLFAALSGIAIDYCGKDGIWCDPGELDRLIEFLEKGGLQLARLKKWEEGIPLQIDPKGEANLPRVMRLVSRAAALFA